MHEIQANASTMAEYMLRNFAITFKVFELVQHGKCEEMAAMD